MPFFNIWLVLSLELQIIGESGFCTVAYLLERSHTKKFVLGETLSINEGNHKYILVSKKYINILSEFVILQTLN